MKENYQVLYSVAGRDYPQDEFDSIDFIYTGVMSFSQSITMLLQALTVLNGCTAQDITVEQINRIS